MQFGNSSTDDPCENTNILLCYNNRNNISLLFQLGFLVMFSPQFCFKDRKIGSLNVRGLRDRLKRQEMFDWLRRKKFSIYMYMLQEVHCSEITIPVWSAEWGCKTICSCCISAKGGIAILFNNNFDFQLERTYVDPNGRFIICDITTDKKCVTIATLYMPNEDDPNFFSKFFDHLNDFECDNIIIGGDFNLVLNLDVDKGADLLEHTQNRLKL